ncbi:Asp23/Gls24 family envelope stress response protein [Arthrobacter russicus]|uniref:Alkaline shock family protein YloU n=1 Tax=Arthrobacter russicus TaxID=172040 RepID=A0ABU1JA30_9MICC|nr:Asp23/Gls24 family envelope stress response protein [Arthrobacter russicus]MBQ1444771.1 Asp23/Gls24 family envelope stress response protein [Renibacterium sp.]MDN5669429.1 Asp23/Gls24 family envelope stress response protein [Renibacterium salmoninarum]MDR6269277.1 putative alkaline shock family protein YloU [Arthrobacter russicus]
MSNQPTAAKPAVQNDAKAAQNPDNAGKTTIEDGVVAKVVGIATRDVAGVYALGGGAARAIGAIRDAVGNTDLTQGVSVEVGEKQVAVDITMVVEYPKPLKSVADEVRSAVYSAVEELVGLDVVEVNITISDIHIPSEDKDDSQTKEESKNTETAKNITSGSRVE